MIKPETRELDDGSHVVCLGEKWFRLMPSGNVIARETTTGSMFTTIRTRSATFDETKMVRDIISKEYP